MDTMTAAELTQQFRDNLADYSRVGNDRARAVHALWQAAGAAGRPPPERPPPKVKIFG